MSTSTSMTIVGVICKEKEKLTCFDTSYETYTEATNHFSSDFKLIIVCKLEAKKTKYLYIDLDKFINKYHVSISSWEELHDSIVSCLNDTSLSKVLVYTPVPDYQYFKSTKTIDGNTRTISYSKLTQFPSNINNRPFVCSYNYSDYVTAEYVNMSAGKIRNKYTRRTTLPDLVFKAKKSNTIFLENTLVSVNGVVGYPYYNEETKELYVKNGAHMLRDTSLTDQNIVFIDFTKYLPDDRNDIRLSTYKLHECSPDILIKKDEDIWLISNPAKGVLESYLTRDILFWQKASFSMRFAVPILDEDYEQIPLLCFGGRLFFPGYDDINYYQINTDTGRKLIVEFNVSLNTLARILASNLQHAGIFYGLNTIYRATIGLIISNIYADKSFNYQISSDEWKAIEFATQFDIPFVSILCTDKHTAINPILPLSSLTHNILSFKKGTKGILINHKTREIIDYTGSNSYSDMTTASVTAPITPLYINTKEGACRHIEQDIIEIPDSVRYDRFTWEHEPVAFTDKYNQYNVGELIKEVKQFFVLDLLYSPDEPISLIDEDDKAIEEDDDGTPMNPVYTVEYENIRRPKVVNATGSTTKPTYVNIKMSISESKDLEVSGFKGQYEIYNGEYSYDSLNNSWYSVFGDRTRASIEYDETNHVWVLKHYTTDGEKAIAQSASDSQVPYRSKLKWIICNQAGIIPAIEEDTPLLIDEEEEPFEP